MTKLILISLATATAAVLVWQHTLLVQARSTSKHLAEQASTAAHSVRQAEGEATALETALREEQARAADLRKRLAEWDARPEAVGDVPSSPSPGKRWPANQPWCYLPKRDLLRYGFPVFTPAGRLSRAAALLFGCSATQRARVEDSYAAFLEDLQALDRSCLQPVPAISHPGLGKASLHSYELNLPPDQVPPLRERFQAAVRFVLAHTQAELFLKAVDQQLSPCLFELSQPRLRLTWEESQQSKADTDSPPIVVEFNPSPGNLGPWNDSKYLYELDDDTALAFRHYAALLRNSAAK